jgi:hypothetical protein
MICPKHLARLLPVIFVAGCASAPDAVSQTSEAAVVEAPPPEETTCDLAWGNDPSSYDGVDGHYERAGAVPANEMRTMDLSGYQPTSGPAGEATSARTFECADGCPTESGRAQLVSDNAAINPMLLFSSNGFGSPTPDLRDVYNVLGLKRSPDGKISAICLYRLADGPGSSPFLMARK